MNFTFSTADILTIASLVIVIAGFIISHSTKLSDNKTRICKAENDIDDLKEKKADSKIMESVQADIRETRKEIGEIKNILINKH